MPRSRYPWMKFYSGEWLNDVALKSCTLAAQGAWIRIIASMNLDEVSTLSFDLASWQSVAGARSLEETVSVLAELRDHGVADVDGLEGPEKGERYTSRRCNAAICVTSRRLEKGDKVREQGRLRQQRFRAKTVSNGLVPGEKSEVRSQMSERGRKTTRARGALGASDDALFSPSDTGKTQKRDPKKRDPELIKAAGRFIKAYRDRDDFQCSDATIRKKFYSLVEDGIHTVDAIFWLLGEWENSEEWKKGYRCAPDKFLTKANQKYRKPPPADRRGGSLSHMDYSKGPDDV